MNRILVCFSLLILCYTCSAQEKVLKPQSLSLKNYEAKTTCTLFTSSLLPAKPLPNYNFTYSLPKGAIFCRMEDALHQRFNIWIKFRMGDDDRYSN